MSAGLTGRVFTTGGSGFLGRALMKRAEEEGWDCSFTVYSRDEYKQDLCRYKYPSATYILGDIRDAERLSVAMAGHDLVIHAGALKYVPEAEVNVSEALSINALGSKVVRDVALRLRVPKLIGISTDKAVNPINVYGMTKALMERLWFEHIDAELPTQCVLVRYGNVIGSTGSVIPLFKRQLESGGSVKLTDPKMTRFWLTWRDAVDLVVEAAACGGGTMILPQPRAMNMRDLANTVCAMQGYSSQCIDIIGTRLGEKQHEELITVKESLVAREVDNYWYVYPRSVLPLRKDDMRFKLTSDNPYSWFSEAEMAGAMRAAEAI
jgi:UDP-N-acetylglucosamine 4,6-dehydratase